jgi:guanine nucleotide-binding protein subunit alpha
MTCRRLKYDSCISIGAGESGKSTILKQMKLLHDGGYTQDERQAFKEIIFSNTIQPMQAILEAMQNLGCRLKDENRLFASVILDQSCQVERNFLPPDVTQAIKVLWKDPNLQSVFERSREYQLNDSAK